MHIENDTIPKPMQSLFYAKQSTGIVVKDSDETGNQNTVGVYIPRLMFGMDISKGAEESQVTLKNTKIVNSEDKNIGSTSVKVRNYVELPFFIIPNLMVPRFKNGENVCIDFADDDIKSMYVLPYKMNEMYKRKTDMYTIMVPAKEKEDDEVTLENSYAFQFDSDNKLITIIMNNANGEKSKYFLTFDGDKGEVALSDNDKRYIKINTDKDKIEAVNESGTSVTMEKKKLSVVCEDYEINAKNSYTLKTKTMKVEAETLKLKATTEETEVDTLKQKGSTMEIKYTKIKKEGTSEEGKFNKVVHDAPVVSISGIAGVGGIGFESPLGVKPNNAVANVDKTGKSNFARVSALGKPLAISEYTVTALKSIATVVDSLCGIFGIPPTLNTTISLLKNVISSKYVKG